MSGKERRKGVAGEREVAALFREHGFTVRGLEGRGDWLAIGNGHLINVETKRQEVARPWAWQEQALADAVPDSLPLVAFRRSRSRWWGMSPLDGLLAGLAKGYETEGAALALELERLNFKPGRR